MNADQLIALGLPVDRRHSPQLSIERRREVMRVGSRVNAELLAYAAAAHERIAAIEDDPED